ncbi:MAG: bifunctional (p)ppGpp synthetase/guanosine-3',5'-bis(diphosphate) 3'-pyrophosphohydrolase [SAR202 cluster bacterium]|nr:bifunctional (p)ppGpp synthetase/guanosine-3',5'-bis(diphosphate) 3'-pyrophosphohydrolase [SAR202 cluster bacterium]|tara:strand:+ start:9987 stop:12149 length:2163 start_codon:yes stop_codon:yes gene_type:complete
MEFGKLAAKVESYLQTDQISDLRRAYSFAKSAHEGQRRVSGEEFFEHPYQTANELASLQADGPTLIAALLHDVVEDSDTSIEVLELEFGEEVAGLVDGVTKLERVQPDSASQASVSRNDEQLHVESLRKMFVAMARDIRVVLIKLSDRLHNMRTLDFLDFEDRKRIAQETLDIYAPLAHRLGMWQLKWQLEDLAFRYIQPREYKRVSDLVDTKRQERERYITQVTHDLRQAFLKAGISADVSGRPKHLYSIHGKIVRYEQEGRRFADIYDLFALRVIVEDVQECYHALGVAHSLWRPLPGQFDDYIASPRENGYRSLHTTVQAVGNKPVEIQVRTPEMHQFAEYGVAAHWQYKEGEALDDEFEQRITWLRQLLDWQRDVTGAEEFMESVRSDVLPDQVFVYTPKGDIKEMPADSTPLDFAFAVHTELGYQCSGAKVNGKLVTFSTILQNGDTVEILTSRKVKGPSLDWLNPNLGYVRTANGRSKIRSWFRKQAREENLQTGRRIFERESKRLGIELDADGISKIFEYKSIDDLYSDIGTGALGIHQIAKTLLPETEPSPPVVTEKVKETNAEVRILGLDNMETRLAGCCNPIFGENIIGYITRGRGVTIHRTECAGVVNEDEPERLVPADWSDTPQMLPVEISVEAWDRLGLLRDLTTVVSAEKVNISTVSDRHRPDGSVTISLTLHVANLNQLSLMFSRLEEVRGVRSAARIGSGTTSS